MLNQEMLFLNEAQSAARHSYGVVRLPPKVAPAHDVFAEAMLDRTSAHQRRSPLDWVVSLLVHALILLLLVVAPLYFTQKLDLQRFNLTLLIAPAPPAPPVAPPAALAVRRPIRAVEVRYTPGRLTVPLFIPKVIATSPSDAAPPEETFAGIPGGVPGGIPGGIPGGHLGGVFGGLAPNVASPEEALPKETPRAPIRVGATVKPPRLLYGPEPDFPVLARHARIGGIVVIEAIINERGDAVDERATSGHPLLVQAALKAVKERKYEPTILDGEPVPIALIVEVSFHFS